MVSQGSPPNPNSHNLHQFLISDSNSRPNQFVNQHFHSHGAGSSYPRSLGLLPSIQSLGERISRSIDLVRAPLVTEESELNHSRHFLGVSNESNNHPQERLSLSLDSGMLVPPVQYRQRSLIPNVINPSYLFSGEETREVCNAGLDRLGDNYSFTVTGFASSSTPFDQSSSNFYGTEPCGNSKYLKAAQSLLEELVNIGGKEEVESSNDKYVRRLSRDDKRGSLRLRFELRAELCHNEFLSMEKHELQARIANLVALLEEIERRFEQYYRHMEEMVSSFEAIAGLGAGKSYTALALQAMSRHFCTLRDAIISQIYETRRKLSLEMPRISTGLSQMSLFDQETARHNRVALQQLGMIQSPRQTWRPIRGLPETSVAILRSWLFEHFLNPYPNDSEKLVLASQTGLTKNQVSNWFINARVRLWKPMIEEMYKEEFEGLVD